ncbi:MAG TPA: hypothetical protein VM870_10400, partial [Pyrinomonadaceae bacterium]|nr:hypothetical protein [Pyrinomonadaceae bacterium]
MQRPNAPATAHANADAPQQPRATPPRFAEVAVPLRVQGTFTYRLPEALREEARVGSRLLVPF